MKVLIVFLFCIVTVTSEENCTSRADCLHTQCCVKDYYGIEQFCQNLTDNGEECTTQLNSGSSREVYTGLCPCKPGYDCDSDTKKCKPKKTNLPQECKTADDCPDDKCCVRDFYNKTQSCQPLTKSGEICLDDQTSQSKDKIFEGKCPCMSGFKCSNKSSKVPNSPYKCVEKRQECKTANDCPDDKCCLKDINNKKQYCQPLTKSDQICLSDLTSQSNNKVFTGKCPCKSGFRCDKNTYSGENSIYRCNEVKKSECDATKDCPENHCCLITGRYGERSCKHVPYYDQYCDVDQYYNETKVYRDQCPCGKGYHCGVARMASAVPTICMYGLP